MRYRIEIRLVVVTNSEGKSEEFRNEVLEVSKAYNDTDDIVTFDTKKQRFPSCLKTVAP